MIFKPHLQCQEDVDGRRADEGQDDDLVASLLKNDWNSSMHQADFLLIVLVTWMEVKILARDPAAKRKTVMAESCPVWPLRKLAMT